MHTGLAGRSGRWAVLAGMMCGAALGLAWPAETLEERAYTVGPTETLYVKVPRDWTQSVDLRGDDSEGSIAYTTGPAGQTIEFQIVPIWGLRQDGRRLTPDEFREWSRNRARKECWNEGYVGDSDTSDLDVRAVRWGFDIVAFLRRKGEDSGQPLYCITLKSFIGREGRELMWESQIRTDDPEGPFVNAVANVAKSMRLVRKQRSANDLSQEQRRQIDLLIQRVDGYYTELKSGHYRRLRGYSREEEDSSRTRQMQSQREAWFANNRLLSWTIVEVGLMGEHARVDVELEFKTRPPAGGPWSKVSSAETLFWGFYGETWYEVDRQRAADTWDATKAVFVPIP